MTPDLTFRYQSPFDWSAIADFLALREVAGLEEVSSEAYARTARENGHCGTITVRPLADSELGVWVSPKLAAVGESLEPRVRALFDLDTETEPIAGHLAADPLLAESVEAHPGLRVPGAWDVFELTVRAVLGQQVTVKGASTLCARLVDAYGAPVDGGERNLVRAFPTAETLAAANLDGLGLTKTRVRTLQALASAVASGDIPFGPEATYADFAEALMAIPGIGDWTAQYVAMRARHDSDAFPASDLVLRKAIADGPEPVTPKVLFALAERWRPYRAYAAMHLWRTMA